MPEILQDCRAQGMLIGLGLAFAIGFASRQVLFAWNSVLQFFKPTAKPATNPGPSPFASLSTCLTNVLWLVLVSLAAVALYSVLAR